MAVGSEIHRIRKNFHVDSVAGKAAALINRFSIIKLVLSALTCCSALPASAENGTGQTVYA